MERGDLLLGGEERVRKGRLLGGKTGEEMKSPKE